MLVERITTLHLQPLSHLANLAKFSNLNLSKMP